MESGNRTAELTPNEKIREVIRAAKKEVFQLFNDQQEQCEALQSENERLKEEANKAIFEMLVEKGRNVQSEKENTRLLERVKEMTEALRSIEPFASEVVSRQTTESVFGFNSQMLTLSSLKKIIAALNPKE
jgi:predicted phage gp36 major capsid-like protein